MTDTRGSDSDLVYVYMYRCPACGRMKDPNPEQRHKLKAPLSSAWCHAYMAHGGPKRRMEKVRVWLDAEEIRP